MNGGRTLLVGGLSSVHDPLLAAALSGLGTPAVALHPRTFAGLRRARALGNHGQCNPAHYAAGAVLEHARRSGEAPAAFAARHAWLTVGSCGPCRLAAYGFEYARVFEGAGLGGLAIVVAEQLAFVGGAASRGVSGGPRPDDDGPVAGHLSALDPASADALLLALIAGDVLATLGHRLRPYARDPDEVEALLDAGAGALAGALERRASIIPALHDVRARAGGIATDLTRVLPRVLLVGEPWTTLSDGDPSYDLARRLGRFGAQIDAPAAAEWLRYLLWEEEERASSSPDGAARIRCLRRADRRIRAMWRLLAGAAGLPPSPLADMRELAALAAPHYDPRVKGGSAHLEIGRALRAARDRSAHLVISIKPFGCLPSSAISDGILSVLARGLPGIRFLAVETTGDADAAAESRIEMAVHAATLAALDGAGERASGRHLSAGVFGLPPIVDAPLRPPAPPRSS